MLENPDYWTRWFQLSDRFGDYGLCGFVVVKKDANIWELQAFVMSCRAMGRGLEVYMLTQCCVPLIQLAARSCESHTKKLLKTSR